MDDNRNNWRQLVDENSQVNGMIAVKAVVVKESTYQKLKRLSKKYNLQTNDPKFARVWVYALYAWHMCLYRYSYRGLMIDERECPQINRELKEIGPQADEDVMND